MRVRVTHDIDDLASDMVGVASKAAVEMPQIVARNAVAGNRLAQTIARRNAGPHGLNYYKRLTAEAVGPLSWEYGPEGIPKSNFVGVGYRSGGNRDLEKSATVQGARFSDDVRRMLDGLFW